MVRTKDAKEFALKKAKSFLKGGTIGVDSCDDDSIAAEVLNDHGHD